MAVLTVRPAGGLPRRRRRLDRGIPLLMAVLAMAVTIGVFPDALHSTLSAPGRQAAIRPGAQAGVTHEGDVPPLSLGTSGAGANGSGAGTGQNPNALGGGDLGGGSGGAVGAGAGAGGGAGAGTGPGGGAGSGPGGGTGPNESTPSPTPPTGPLEPTPTPTPVPPGVGCSSCTPPSGAPSIPFCYSNSLGPHSQTTEDPLSPPCVTWDPSTGNGGATSQGVSAGQIDVALLGVDPSEDDYINSPATPSSDVCSEMEPNGGLLCYGRNVKVLRQFFLNHFQTYGRNVVFHGWSDFSFSLHGKALADAIESSLHPFALLMTPSLICCYTPDDVVAFARDGIETFTFNDIAVNEGLIDQSVVEAGSPYLWTVAPTTDQIIDNAAAWVCDTLLPNPVAVSNDPKVSNGSTPRHVALGYAASPGVAAGVAMTPAQQVSLSASLANRLAAAADARCPQQGRPLFDRFNCDGNGQNCAESVEIYDPNDQTVSTRNLGQLQHDGVTTVICVLCGPTFGSDFAQTEALLQYFPEMLFVSGDARDPYFPRNSDQLVVKGMTGLSELWQLPGYTQTYWFRAYNQTDATSTISQLQGFDLYELLMHLFSAVQLAGPDLTSSSVALGGGGTDQVGLCGLRRSFTYSATSALRPPTSPAAGHVCAAGGSPPLVRTGFLQGLTEERWDPAGVPPGGPYPSIYRQNQGGCYRIIDPQHRYSITGGLGTTPWPSGDDSADPSAPCTGDTSGVGGTA